MDIYVSLNGIWNFNLRTLQTSREIIETSETPSTFCYIIITVVQDAKFEKIYKLKFLSVGLYVTKNI